MCVLSPTASSYSVRKVRGLPKIQRNGHLVLDNFIFELQFASRQIVTDSVCCLSTNLNNLTGISPGELQLHNRFLSDTNPYWPTEIACNNEFKSDSKKIA